MITDLIIMFIIDIIMEITTLTIIIIVIIIIMIAITSEIISSYHLSYASYRLWLSVSILFWFTLLSPLFPKFIYSILFLVSAYSLVHFTLPSLFYNHLSLLFLSPLHSFLCFYHFFSCLYPYHSHLAYYLTVLFSIVHFHYIPSFYLSLLWFGPLSPFPCLQTHLIILAYIPHYHFLSFSTLPIIIWIYSLWK